MKAASAPSGIFAKLHCAQKSPSVLHSSVMSVSIKYPPPFAPSMACQKFSSSKPSRSSSVPSGAGLLIGKIVSAVSRPELPVVEMHAAVTAAAIKIDAASRVFVMVPP